MFFSSFGHTQFVVSRPAFPLELEMYRWNVIMKMISNKDDFGDNNWLKIEKWGWNEDHKNQLSLVSRSQNFSVLKDDGWGLEFTWQEVVQ